MRRKSAVLVSAVMLATACGGEAAPHASPISTAQTGASAPPLSATTSEPVDLPSLPFGDELAQILAAGVDQSGGLGVTAAVITPGFSPWAGAAGDSVRGDQGVVTMNPEMLFEIGSIDKHFTAALALRLQELGLLDLDAPLSDWLSGYANLHPDITVRHLLASTSGVAEWVDHPDSLFKAPWNQIDWDRKWTVDAMLTELVGDPEFAPGERWQYSTTGFRLARHVIEQTTDQPWAVAVRQYLLEPVGISDVWMAGEEPVPVGAEIAHEWYDTDGDGNLEDITGQTAAQYSLKPGGLHSSALDLARWCRALFVDRSVLSGASLAEMTAFRPADDPSEPLAAEYGLGLGRFALPVLSGVDHYGHSGYSFGYITAMIFLEDSQTCVSFMVNDGLTVGFMADDLLEAVIAGT